MMKKRILLGMIIGMLNINGLSAVGGPAEESNPVVPTAAQIAAQAVAQAFQYPAVPNFSPPMGGAMVQEPSARQVETNAKLARLVEASKQKRKKEKGSWSRTKFSHSNGSCRDGGRKPSGGGSSGGLGGGGGSNISV